jgi:hypothetical protein
MNRNLLYVGAVLLGFILIQLIGFKVMERVLEDRLSKRLAPAVVYQVIDSLRKEYSPGPYSPGFDPDKIDPRLMRQEPR